MKNNNDNRVTVQGKLIKLNRIWSHKTEHTITEGIIEIIRDSGVKDLLPVLFTAECPASLNDFVQITGQFRSRDLEVNGRLKVDLYIHVQTIEPAIDANSINNIVVDGFICKKPTLRTTPSGKQICDLLIACNYNKDKTAYLPIIVWGRAARQIGKASVGSHIQITGRVQSRVYTKHAEDGQMHEHMAYEISATTITESSQTLFSLN